MCGFTVIIKNEPLSTHELVNQQFVLNHRGPDATGIYLSKNKKVGFIHNRLSFLDLSSDGNQPFLSEDERFVIVFNGEIYNYKKLKSELQLQGIEFRTNTDTEVILKGYIKEGAGFINKLEGMFSFVVYDQETSKLIAVRDRFGIKPLYYYTSSNVIVFSSEIKGILASISPKRLTVRKESIALFLANRYVPTPFTIWEDVFKLEPAHFLELDSELNKKKSEYWRLELDDKRMKFSDLSKLTDEMLKESVNSHLISDVQIGGFLSGGYDSSALALYARRTSSSYPTFSIGFTNWDDSEDKYAKIVANHLNLDLSTELSPKIDLDNVGFLMNYYDDPIADISILPTFQVSKLAAQNVKAVLSGEGADEIFGGYWWNKDESFHFSSHFNRLKNSVFGKSFADIKTHYIFAMSMGLFDFKELNKALIGDFKKSIPHDPFEHFNKFEVKGTSTVKQLQILDIKTFMYELVLQKIDRASMANSLEVRVPFLDHKLVELYMSLSSDSYMRRGVQKPVLRDLLMGKLPNEILERKKQGFVGPDSFYMNISYYKSVLVTGRLIKDEVISPFYLNEKLDNKDHWRLWKLFVLELWWQKWMN
jgi:asparagine synthase (glutamine-hydrolysing)